MYPRRTVTYDFVFMCRLRYGNLHIFKDGIVYIVEHDGRAIVRFLGDKRHIIKPDVLSMPDIKAPCRELLKHRKFRILILHLGNTVQLIQSHFGIQCITPSWIPNFDIFQRHIFDGDRRNTGKACYAPCEFPYEEKSHYPC